MDSKYIFIILGLIVAAVIGYFLLVPTGKKGFTEATGTGTGTGGGINTAIQGNSMYYRLEGESMGDFIARRNNEGWTLDTRLFK